MTQTISDALHTATLLLERTSASARLDAELLLEYVTGLSRTDFRAAPERALPAPAGWSYQQLLRRRLQGEPIAYIRGHQEFWSLLLEVTPAVLIPRPETELVVERTLAIITRIITAGITWLIGLLNPAAAFIKACKLIYDVIMFFVNNAERIAKFVNTVIDSAADIVRGNIGGVVAKIEDVLSQMVPILIGFLASVIGIGGIGQKIREIIGKLQKPVTKAIDFVIKTGLKLAGPVIRGLKGIGGKVKAKVAAGKAKLKAKVLGGDDSPEGKQKRLKLAQAALHGVLGRGVKGAPLRATMAAIKLRYGLKDLRVEQQGDRKVKFVGEINPVFEEFAEAIPVIDRTTEGDDSVGLETMFRSMSLRELLRIAAGAHMGIKKDKKTEEASGEPGISEQKLYAISYVERKQKDQKDVSKYRYAVMVQIDFEPGALAELMHGPHGTMDHGTAVKLENDGEGELVDKGSLGKFFVFHTKREDLPKEVRIHESSPRRNKLVFKLERSPKSPGEVATNYLIVAKYPDQDDDIAKMLAGKVRRVSVVGGVQGQVTAELVSDALAGK